MLQNQSPVCLLTSWRWATEKTFLIVFKTMNASSKVAFTFWMVLARLPILTFHGSFYILKILASFLFPRSCPYGSHYNVRVFIQRRKSRALLRRHCGLKNQSFWPFFLVRGIVPLHWLPKRIQWGQGKQLPWQRSVVGGGLVVVVPATRL